MTRDFVAPPKGTEQPLDDRDAAFVCWDCGEVPVEREGLICDECNDRSIRIASGSLDADRAERGDDDDE